MQLAYFKNKWLNWKGNIAIKLTSHIRLLQNIPASRLRGLPQWRRGRNSCEVCNVGRNAWTRGGHWNGIAPPSSQSRKKDSDLLAVKNIIINNWYIYNEFKRDWQSRMRIFIILTISRRRSFGEYWPARLEWYHVAFLLNSRVNE